MAKQLLDKTDVRAALQHERGARVPEQVATAGFADVGLIDIFRTICVKRPASKARPTLVRKRARRRA